MSPDDGATGPRTLAFVGSWTSSVDGAVPDGGVRVFDVGADGRLTRLSEVAPEINAGDLALSPDGRMLYCVDERRDSPRSGFAGGAVASFVVDPAAGRLSQQRLTPTGAALPCHVSVSPSGDLVAVANHGSYEFAVRTARSGAAFAAVREFDSGAVSLMPVDAEGSLGEPTDVAVLAGRAPGTRAPVLTDPSGRFTAEFQASSHPHAAVFHPTEPVLVVPDKGTDTIHVFGVDHERKRLAALQRLEAEPGTGPRHARFHPSIPVAYVVNELVPSLTVLAWDAGTRQLRPVQTVSTMPEPGGDVTWPSELVVHPSGRFVYVSNRGHDSIAGFRVLADGTLVASDIVGSGGRTPRAFDIDPSGAWLFALNQESGTIVTFALDAHTGAPSSTGAIAHVERPVSIALA